MDSISNVGPDATQGQHCDTIPVRRQVTEDSVSSTSQSPDAARLPTQSRPHSSAPERDPVIIYSSSEFRIE
jgi:hypothetical protein